MALPGGKREDGDAFPEGTALREACEEVGLDADAAGVTTMGVLETVDVRVSGFMMVPVLAVAEREPHFIADDREVAQILTVPVRHFLPDAPVETGGRGPRRLAAALRRLSGSRPPRLGRHGPGPGPARSRPRPRAGLSTRSVDDAEPA